MRFIEGGDTDYQLKLILNNGIDFQDNIRGALVEVEFVDGELTLEHALGFTPIGFIILWKDGASDIWATRPLEWDNQRLYLASSVPSLKARLFVM